MVVLIIMHENLCAMSYKWSEEQRKIIFIMSKLTQVFPSFESEGNFSSYNFSSEGNFSFESEAMKNAVSLVLSFSLLLKVRTVWHGLKKISNQIWKKKKQFQKILNQIKYKNTVWSYLDYSFKYFTLNK